MEVDSFGDPQARSNGASACRRSSHAERYLVGLADRVSMGGHAKAIRSGYHLLASAASLGGTRRVDPPVADHAADTGQSWPIGVEPGFLRWEFRSREKGGEAVGLTRKGKGTKWMVVVDDQGAPLGVLLASANEAEVQLAEATLDTIRVPRPRGRPRKRPASLVADKGYDSQPLRRRLRRRGIRPCIPERKGKRPRAGRKPDESDYRHRWKVERTFAWLGHFRRLVVRQEHLIGVYRGFFILACALIVMSRLLQ